MSDVDERRAYSSTTIEALMSDGRRAIGELQCAGWWLCVRVGRCEVSVLSECCCFHSIPLHIRDFKCSLEL